MMRIKDLRQRNWKLKIIREIQWTTISLPVLLLDHRQRLEVGISTGHQCWDQLLVPVPVPVILLLMTLMDFLVLMILLPFPVPALLLLSTSLVRCSLLLCYHLMPVMQHVGISLVINGNKLSNGWRRSMIALERSIKASVIDHTTLLKAIYSYQIWQSL